MNERRAELIYGQVLQRMDMTRETGDEELQELIRMTLEEASEKEYLPLNEKIELSRELFHAFRKLDNFAEPHRESGDYRNYGEWNGSYFL